MNYSLLSTVRLLKKLVTRLSIMNLIWILQYKFLHLFAQTTARNQLKLHQVTERQVEIVIRRLPSNKASGMDKIPPRILKDSLPTTIHYRQLPALWTTLLSPIRSHVHGTRQRSHLLILKCSNPKVPNNYRRISLLPIISKITERLPHGQLMEYLTSNNKLAVNQSRNRKFHS